MKAAEYRRISKTLPRMTHALFHNEGKSLPATEGGLELVSLKER
jgi:hypothetical protein